VRILDVINRTAPYLEKQGIESPRLTIELLLAHVLRKKRLELYLEFERDLDDAILDQLRTAVKRRVEGEPLQYIIGEVEFCGLKFAVDRRVLIPRPETELLVEQVAEVRRVVDVGTGSGCIAVALATRFPAMEILATDVSAEALTVAQANALRHGLEKKIRFFHGDLLDALPSSSKVDAVVSNPPYVASGEIGRLPKEIRDFEPMPALVAGDDGLEVFRRLVPDGTRILSPGGRLYLELGAGQRPAVEQLCVAAGYTVVEVVRDLQRHERVLIAAFGETP
jgi:release factor glutamine methyltransferase